MQDLCRPYSTTYLIPSVRLPNAFYSSNLCAATTSTLTLANALGYKQSVPLVIIPQNCGLFLAFSSKISPQGFSCFT